MEIIDKMKQRNLEQEKVLSRIRMFNASPIGVHTSLVRKDIDGKDEEAATTL